MKLKEKELLRRRLKTLIKYASDLYNDYSELYNYSESDMKNFGIIPYKLWNNLLRKKTFFKNNSHLRVWKSSKDWIILQFDDGNNSYVNLKNNVVKNDLEKIASSFGCETKESQNSGYNYDIFHDSNLLMRLNFRYMAVSTKHFSTYLIIPISEGIYEKHKINSH